MEKEIVQGKFGDVKVVLSGGKVQLIAEMPLAEYLKSLEAQINAKLPAGMQPVALMIEEGIIAKLEAAQ